MAANAIDNPSGRRLPADHPERRIAADEVHARPQEALDAPLRASYLALMVAPAEREQEWTHILALFRQMSVTPPATQEAHLSAALGTVRMKWERHGEFSTYLFTVPGTGAKPFSETAMDFLPQDWLAAVPGRTVVAAQAIMLAADETRVEAESLTTMFDGGVPVGAEVGDGAGSAFTDFRIHADGHSRFVVCDRAFTQRQAGRTLQRLFEVETYRVLALLALPLARRLAPQVVAIERAFGALTEALARESGSDELLLGELTKHAAEVESLRHASQMRFAASKAYYELVLTRIGELRERRVAGIQTIEEFMTRRLTPAMATCSSVAQRLRDLSERAAQLSSLLSTRVEIARERQNQVLLASMERRAGMQLRLQQTVEWLSIAAVTYYAAGLVGYACKALKAAGWAIDPDRTVGVAIPVIALLSIAVLRWARKQAGHGPNAGE